MYTWCFSLWPFGHLSRRLRICRFLIYNRLFERKVERFWRFSRQAWHAALPPAAAPKQAPLSSAALPPRAAGPAAAGTQRAAPAPRTRRRVTGRAAGPAPLGPRPAVVATGGPQRASGARGRRRCRPPAGGGAHPAAHPPPRAGTLGLQGGSSPSLCQAGFGFSRSVPPLAWECRNTAHAMTFGLLVGFYPHKAGKI